MSWSGKKKDLIGRADPRQVSALRGVVDTVVNHIKAEVEQARMEGKPPLIIFLESHYDRENLAKELAIMLRLKNEAGVNNLSVELPANTCTDWITAANNAHRAVDDVVQFRGHTDFDATYRNIQPIFESIPNMAVLSNVAMSAGMQVDFVANSALPGYGDYDVETTADTFVANTKDADSRLVDLLQKDSNLPRIMVMGTWHGKAVADAAAQDYHVIPISLSLRPADRDAVWTNLGADVSIANIDAKTQRGAALSENEQLLFERARFAEQSFDATKSIGGFQSISSAVGAVKRMNNAGVLPDKAMDSWHSLSQIKSGRGI